MRTARYHQTLNRTCLPGCIERFLRSQHLKPHSQPWPYVPPYREQDQDGECIIIDVLTKNHRPYLFNRAKQQGGDAVKKRAISRET